MTCRPQHDHWKVIVVERFTVISTLNILTLQGHRPCFSCRALAGSAQFFYPQRACTHPQAQWGPRPKLKPCKTSGWAAKIRGKTRNRTHWNVSILHGCVSSSLSFLGLIKPDLFRSNHLTDLRRFGDKEMCCRIYLKPSHVKSKHVDQVNRHFHGSKCHPVRFMTLQTVAMKCWNVAGQIHESRAKELCSWTAFCLSYPSSYLSRWALADRFKAIKRTNPFSQAGYVTARPIKR